METSNPSSSARLLIRPPSSSASSAAPLPAPSSSPLASPDLPTPPPPPKSSPSVPSRAPPPSSQARPPDGVVVVGFVGRRPDDVTPLINRVLDTNAFGSGNLDQSLCIEKEEFRDWFGNRRISYYHEEERGILYLQYCSRQCPAMGTVSDSQLNFDAVLEERDFGDLQGFLFMFSVCHVIVYVQEGSRFDTQILKKFRVLQAAKHALTSFVRSQMPTPLATRPHSSLSTQPSASLAPKNPSPGRSGGISNRNASAASPMSGFGSHASLLPGRCTPVALFGFLDDFSDTLDSGSNVEDTTDTPAMNQSSNSNSFARPSLPTKGSGPVVVLARPVSRSEIGFRKKLQSSLEAQIRFLIKKCRTLTGSENGQAGSRNAAGSGSAPLFSLDASRSIVLLDRYTNQKGESLEFATSLVQDLLNGKSSSDSFLQESHGQSVNREDIQSIKEFINRQCDILRGRGGVVANTNSGSAAGVGMVAAAAAAAAAAASASSKKTFTVPQLPSLETWLSSSQSLLQELLSAKRRGIEEAEMSKRKPRQRNTAPQHIEAITSRITEHLEAAVSLLDSGKGMNMKFSTLWCQRSLPAAKEVYLKELPTCYPTSLHEAHLEKALHVFCSMVKGPAVRLFMKKLEDECITIWTTGRQQCDAVSLTGNPCLHRIHGVEGAGSPSGAEVKPHSSGFVFLHACACGRSRKLRSDPFDFQSANITSSHFPDCDKLLPAVQLPNVSLAGPIQTSSWSLIRVGSARYYEPFKGLLQSGFCATQKFLLKWRIFIEKRKDPPGSSDSTIRVPAIRSNTAPKVGLIESKDSKKSGVTQSYSIEAQSNVVGNQIKPLENIKSDGKNINFGIGLPNFTMKKPFSEVVAGSAAADSGFPPLHPRKQPSSDSEMVPKQTKARDRGEGRGNATANKQGSEISEDISPVQENSNGVNANGHTGGESFLQIGSNVVPVSGNGGGKMKLNASLKHVTIYVGFEHECPHGHRFLLTPEHLNDIGSLTPEEDHLPSSVENTNCKVEDPIKLRRNASYGKVHRHSNGRNIAALSRLKNSDKTKEVFGNGFHYLEGVTQSSGFRKELDQESVGLSNLCDSEDNIHEHLRSLSLDDGGYAFSLLNRNLPVYMNCPHCRISKAKGDPLKIKFANSLSQLQRIFVVTPPFPVVLATCPAIQFEASCLPSFIPDCDRLLQFSLGSQVILPPESFLTLRLPFVYGVQLDNGCLHPLRPLEHQPELTAWIKKGTTLQVLSREAMLVGDSQCG